MEALINPVASPAEASSDSDTSPCNSSNTQPVAENEHTPIIRIRSRHSLPGNCKCPNNICISSKAALLILVCSFFVSYLLATTVLGISIQFLSFAYYFDIRPVANVFFLQLVLYKVAGVILLFFPLGGYCGDVKCGRHKIIKHSLCVCLTVMILLIPANFYIVRTLAQGNLLGLPLIIIIVLFALCPALVFFVAYICFTANVIQFGMDQLYESPSQHSSLFIYWFVWANSASVLVEQLFQFIIIILTSTYSIIVLLILFSIVPMIGFTISCCLFKRKQTWFLIDSAQRINPYKLVRKITKFAYQHKVPVNRSAFTYCEDQYPTRLDLGKEKYGGPFVNEEVEDTKVFYGILKVLFALGPVFFLDAASGATISRYDSHKYVSNTSDRANMFFTAALHSNYVLSSLLIVFAIPVYLCAFRPHISRYMPGMLRRIGIGIALNLVILISKLVASILVSRLIDAEVDTSCVVNCEVGLLASYTQLETPFQVLQLLLYTLSNMLVYIAMYEFICSQSPKSMKGMLIGLSFAIKGLFQLLATITALNWYNATTLFSSLGTL